MRAEHSSVEELSAMLDGRLSEGERATVEAHVAACASCREDLERLRATVAALRALPQARAPRSFRVSDARGSMREPGHRGLLVLFPRPAVLRALAGIAAALMVVVFAADSVRPARFTATSPENQAPAPALAPAPPPPDLPASAPVAPSFSQERGAPLAALPAPPPQSTTAADAAEEGQPVVAAGTPEARLPAAAAERSPPPAATVEASPPETGAARTRATGMTAPPEARLPEAVAPGQPSFAPGSQLTAGRLFAFALGLAAIALLAVSFRRPAR